MTDNAIKPPVHAVVFQQVGVGFGVTKIIDRHNLHGLAIIVFVKCTENIASDTAKSVNTYANRGSENAPVDGNYVLLVLEVA